MTHSKMHTNEFDITPDLVKKLVSTQFPDWSYLRIKPVQSAGTDNAMYQLGDAMVIRLPRIESANLPILKEQQFLPHLANQLPLIIPQLIADGKPDDTYPWHWSIYSWIDGNTVEIDNLNSPEAFIQTLAHFIHKLHSLPKSETPIPGHWQQLRGVPLMMRDKQTRKAIQALDGMIDTQKALQAWESALAVHAWDNDLVWIHGDLQKGNLLEANGELVAVIDFGCLDVGDPACDLQVAWNLIPKNMRDDFRNALNYDDATWARGRGWALSVGVIALPYYYKTNPTLAGIARQAIQAVIED